MCRDLKSVLGFTLSTHGRIENQCGSYCIFDFSALKDTYTVFFASIKSCCDAVKNPTQPFGSFQVPNRVENLRVSVATENSLSLAWTKPSGKVDFYQVEVDGQKIRSTVEEAQVMALTPGRSYTVRVQSGVQDGKNLSAESTITAFTSGLTCRASHSAAAGSTFWIET